MTNASRERTGAQGAGRLALILAAERLIAQHGIRGFTFRELNAAANTRNTSAVLYHFGSREELVRAVAEYRLLEINPRRMAMLERIDATDLRSLAETLILPLAHELQPRAEGNFYIRFQERLERDTDSWALEGLPEALTEGWRMTEDLIRHKLSHLRPSLTEIRLRLVRTLILSGLSSEEARLTCHSPDAGATALTVEALKDAVVAVLAAPPSEDAEAAAFSNADSLE